MKPYKSKFTEAAEQPKEKITLELTADQRQDLYYAVTDLYEQDTQSETAKGLWEEVAKALKLGAYRE